MHITKFKVLIVAAL